MCEEDWIRLGEEVGRIVARAAEGKRETLGDPLPARRFTARVGKETATGRAGSASGICSGRRYARGCPRHPIRS